MGLQGAILVASSNNLEVGSEAKFSFVGGHLGMLCSVSACGEELRRCFCLVLDFNCSSRYLFSASCCLLTVFSVYINKIVHKGTC